MLHLIIAINLFGSYACRKQIFKGPDKSGSSSEATVYAAGYVFDGITNTAVYWKNDSIVLLPPTTNDTDNSFAYSIAVSGNQVYVAGAGPDGTVFWKNGISQDFTNVPSSGANAISVSGSDVYIAGYEINDSDGPNGFATYWKNSNPVILSHGSLDAVANGIVVSGNDVYVSGWVIPFGQFAYASYWKNAVEHVLTKGTDYSAASGIAVNGDDVYVVGTESIGSGIAAYWKNSNIVRLTDGSAMASASSIAVAGNDVYVAGEQYNPASTTFYAVYWKNGKMIPLTDISISSTATSIAIAGNDLYIGGMVFKSGDLGYQATYWKNGSPVTLPYSGAPGYRYVMSLFVSQ